MAGVARRSGEALRPRRARPRTTGAPRRGGRPGSGSRRVAHRPRRGGELRRDPVEPGECGVPVAAVELEIDRAGLEADERIEPLDRAIEPLQERRGRGRARARSPSARAIRVVVGARALRAHRASRRDRPPRLGGPAERDRGAGPEPERVRMPGMAEQEAVEQRFRASRPVAIQPRARRDGDRCSTWDRASRRDRSRPGLPSQSFLRRRSSPRCRHSAPVECPVSMRRESWAISSSSEP